MELSEQIIAERRALVERVTAGQPVPVKKFIFEMLFGSSPRRRFQAARCEQTSSFLPAC